MTGTTRTADAAPHRPEPLPPAPGEERSPALTLANTLTMRGGVPVDALDTPQRAARWLAEQHLTDDDTAHLDDAALARLHHLRQAVRGLLEAAATGHTPDRRQIDGLNDVLRATPVVTTLAWPLDGPPRRHTAIGADAGITRALYRLADSTVALLCGPDAQALSACPAQDCTRLLLRTHGRRQWCGTRCGDRVRAARYYARRHGTADPDSARD